MSKIYSKDHFIEVFTNRRVEVTAALNDAEQTLNRLDGVTPKHLEAELAQLKDKAKTIKAQAEAGTKDAYKKASADMKDLREESVTLRERVMAVNETTEVPITSEKLPKGIRLHPNSIPGYADLSPEKQTEVVEKVTKKLVHGKELMDKMLDDDFEATDLEEPSRKDVSDLVWYIKATAEMKMQEPFAKGAMTIPDSGNQIRKYLDRCDKIYVRKSSHVEEQAKEKKANPEGEKSARGIDFYEGNTNSDLDLTLPYGMNTILMQTVDAGKEKRLYIKMETESAYGSGGIKGKETPKDRPSEGRMDEFGKLVKHGANLFIKDDGGLPAAFREQTDKGDELAYKDLIGAMEDETAIELLKNGYRKGEIGKGNGIRVCDMVGNLQAVMNDGNIDKKACDTAKKMLDELRTKYPDAENQFGREVVLRKDNLQPDKPKTQTGDKKKPKKDEKQTELESESEESFVGLDRDKKERKNS